MQISADEQGNFSIVLPRGHYTVTGTSPLFRTGGKCFGTHDVTVPAPTPSRVVVVCAAK